MEKHYDLNKHNFSVVRQVFTSGELVELRSLIEQRLKASERVPQAYAEVSVSGYDTIVAADAGKSTALKKLSDEVAKAAGCRLELYNSLFIELQGKEAVSKPGFHWHQDTVSFAIMEKGTKALITWIMLENTLEDAGGTMDFLSVDAVSKLTGLDLRERCVNVFETAKYSEKYGIDVTRKGRFVVLDSVTNKVLGFFDRSPDEVCDRPRINVGDLVVMHKDSMHRTSATVSKTGRRAAITIRFLEENARYNGCFDDGIPIFYYGAFENSKLWQRLRKEGRGAKIYV